ncbi:MAG TPA: cytochrome c [Verrucomicrobiae bacterium]|nr:cytochrome c [Verrucomicrobiae bacterium]
MKSEDRRWKMTDGKMEYCFRFYAILYFLSSMLVVTSGCRRDMFVQPKSDPLAANNFFSDDAASRPIPPHTVSRDNSETDTPFYTGMNGTNLVAEFPIKITRQILERGRQRYDIYCEPCHGITGDGNGIVVARGFPQPPSYHIKRLREAPVGHFFDVITHGYGAMYSYAQRVEPEDRWAIAAYIRALQLSGYATTNDVPTNEIAKLNSPP